VARQCREFVGGPPIEITSGVYLPPGARTSTAARGPVVVCMTEKPVLPSMILGTPVREREAKPAILKKESPPPMGPRDENPRSRTR